MGILALWAKWRNACRFEKVGAGCEFPTTPLEVKGHVELGAGCVLRGNLVLRTHKDGRIVLGDGVEVADYAMLASNALIEVGADSYIGPHCVIRDINHVFQGTDVHWRLTPHIVKPIRIGPRCFLGARSYIMPGVTIGEGAVVAPGSIVTRDIGPFEIWAGAPSAQFIAHRTDPERGPARKRHAELLRLFGFDAADETQDAAAAAAAEQAVETAPKKPPVKPKRAVRTGTTKSAEAPAKKKAKAATKRPAAKKTAAKSGRSATAKATPAKPPRSEKTSAPSLSVPASRSARKPAAAKKGAAETPVAVRKALADASDVLKSFAEDK